MMGGGLLCRRLLGVFGFGRSRDLSWERATSVESSILIPSDVLRYVSL